MKLYAEKSKSINFQKKKTHNLETLGGSYNKNATVRDFITVCHPKIGGGHTKKVAIEKHRFATSKEV